MIRSSILLVAAVCLLAASPSSDPPLDDARLSVHTLVREDIFAGIRDGDTNRLARGERSIETLLKQRPAEKPALLVWKAAALMYRALGALDAGRAAEFQEKYAEVRRLLSQAKELGPNDPGVAAATGGLYTVMADRLPKDLRSAAWSTAYDSYQALWKMQARDVEKLPLHMRGELLAGLAQSAQRTGRTQEVSEYLDKILAVAPDSAYAQVARRWKEDAKVAAETHITCLSCHAAGRLAARRAALGEK